MEVPQLHIIAHIRTDFPEKFGIPRQSGLVGTVGKIVFEPAYRVSDALRGIDGFSHLWLLWQFSESLREDWSPTVRPPRLGGNTRMGVFATRSPFRPNAIGLSSVRLLRVETDTPDGPVLFVEGADLMDGTPIYDIKPYLAYTDAHPDAAGGFALSDTDGTLTVACDEGLLSAVAEDKRETLLRLLAQDPRPGYQHDPARVYGFDFADVCVRFTVADDTLTVHSIEKV